MIVCSYRRKRISPFFRPYHSKKENPVADNETQETGVRTLIIQGVTFNMTERYAEGHPLTAKEAGVMNQTLAENLRNNFAKTVIASNEKAEGAIPASRLQEAFDEYAAEYEFATKRTGSTKGLDPIEKEALRLAKGTVHAKLKANGRPLRAPKDASDEAKETYRNQIQATIEKYAQLPSYIADAKANIKRQAKRAEEALAEMNEGGPAAAA